MERLAVEDPWPYWNYDEDPGGDVPTLSVAELRTTAEALSQVFQQRPGEVALALGLTDGEGLPRLLGGAGTTLEQDGRRLWTAMVASSGRQVDPSAPPIHFECRPLTKAEALQRGDLGGDCSSSTVPFRCLSPHHTYYGIYREGVQQRGYITVFECWAALPDGSLTPTLCLETINAPIPELDAAQLDLVHLLEAVAHSRGLDRRLAMVTNGWAWNYLNGTALRRARVARGGDETRLLPADPWSWSVYERAMPHDAGTYTPFRSTASCRLLVPTEPARDGLQPENVAEAARLRALQPRTLQATAWEGSEVRGFISGWPE